MRQNNSVTFDGESRIYSTTSGFSSGGSSSNSVLSCCNDNEECKFNNSVKRYYSLMYQKAPSKLNRDDESFSKDEDSMTLTSSNACGSNCSCYGYNDHIRTPDDEFLDPKCSQLSQSITPMKSIKGENHHSFGQKLLHEKM